MAFTYDPTTDIGMVRLLIGDKDAGDPIFTDEEVTALLLRVDNVTLAAADALDIIASNEAYVQKAIKLLDLTTNGPAVAVALREHATRLRQDVSGREVVLEIAQMDVNNASAYHIWLRDWLANNT